jgi:signal transduction histidine kinase
MLALAVGFVFHRTITRPVRELIVRTCAIARGDKSARRPLEHHGTAEFAQLSQSFLDMATALESRSDYIATFAAHVSHELKSPLTSIQGAAELLRDEMDLPSPAMSVEMRRKFLDNIVAAARRLTAIVNRLRELARAEQAPSDGVCGLAAAVADLATIFPTLDIRSNVNLDVVPRISDENMRIVLSHLADNAERHGATRLDIDAEIRGPVARIRVRDNGAGVSPNNRAHVFDSFFTTRRDSGGTGMGLPIVRALLVAHRGEIELIPSEGGALFALTLPLDEARHV